MWKKSLENVTVTEYIEGKKQRQTANNLLNEFVGLNGRKGQRKIVKGQNYLEQQKTKLWRDMIIHILIFIIYNNV